LIILCSAFLIVHFKLVEKEIKRASSLIIMWSPFFTRNQEAFLIELLVKSFLHTWFRTGRLGNQEAFPFVFLWSPYFTLG
jgi:hypothetical protein